MTMSYNVSPADTIKKHRVKPVELLLVDDNKKMVGYALLLYGFPNKELCLAITHDMPASAGSGKMKMEVCKKTDADAFYRLNIGKYKDRTGIREDGLMLRSYKAKTTK